MKNIIIEMPQEIEVWYVLPAIRREFVKEMVRASLKQKVIALKLGITEAAVSQYMSNKRAKNIKFNRDILQNVRKSVKRILNGESVSKEILEISKKAKESMLVCKFHKKMGASKTCGMCFE